MPALHDAIIYGPVRSRRLGLSLGVNLFPPDRKVCNFNCAYCQYGWTPANALLIDRSAWPSPARVAGAAADRLRRAHMRGETVDRITRAGHGEPTLHPELRAIVDRLRGVRDRLAPSARLAVLSNSSTLASPAVRAAIARLDDAYMKLDAGEPELLKRLNGWRADLEEILAGLTMLPRVAIQSLFVTDRTGRLDNSTDVAVHGWLQAIRTVRPRAVHLYTIDRTPAWPFLQPVSAKRLEAIAARCAPSPSKRPPSRVARAFRLVSCVARAFRLVSGSSLAPARAMFPGRPGHLRTFDYTGLHRCFLTFVTRHLRPLFDSDDAVPLLLDQFRSAARR